MVNPPKYTDFEQVGEEVRTVHGNAVKYALFKCPFAGCGKTMGVPVEMSPAISHQRHRAPTAGLHKSSQPYP